MENENENENEEENRDRNIYKDNENFWEFFLVFPWYKSKWKRTELVEPMSLAVICVTWRVFCFRGRKNEQ